MDTTLLADPSCNQPDGREKEPHGFPGVLVAMLVLAWVADCLATQIAAGNLVLSEAARPAGQQCNKTMMSTFLKEYTPGADFAESLARQVGGGGGGGEPMLMVQGDLLLDPGTPEEDVEVELLVLVETDEAPAKVAPAKSEAEEEVDEAE